MKLVDTATGLYYKTTEKIWQSAEKNLLDLEFNAAFTIDNISNSKPTMWRYREAIPILLDKHIVSMQEGFTPLVYIDFNGKKVGIKQEQLFSTGSYKDRGASVLLSHIKSLGIQKIIQDSSGNAGCAVAAYAALANIDCTIYVQKNTKPSKIAQMQAYGATIISIDGTRENVSEAALIAAQTTYYASHSWNPYFFEGTKTFAYEICEQLGWKAPDSVVLPAGNGTLIIGCYIGFMDLLKAGVIHKMPKIIAIQSQNCNPLEHAFANNLITYTPIPTLPTIAEGIAIAKPIRGNQLLNYVRESKGEFMTVTEAEITSAWKECAAKGFYIETTSAATIAGLKKYIQNHPEEEIISLFSGHGLKG